MSLLTAVASLPKYEAILPDSGMKIQYRPFIMKEEKILLMAAETKNEQAIYNALRDVILSCTSNALDIMNISPTDLEYLFIQLRINSIGNKATPSIKCKNCDEYNETEISLSDIKVVKPAEQSREIKITPVITVHMKNICIKDMISVSTTGKNNIEQLFEAVARSIDKVFVNDTMYDSKDYTMKEMQEFVEGLTQPQVTKLLEFLENTPRMQCDVNFKCKKCSYDNTVTLRGITSFF